MLDLPVTGKLDEALKEIGLEGGAATEIFLSVPDMDSLIVELDALEPELAPHQRNAVRFRGLQCRQAMVRTHVVYTKDDAQGQWLA